MAKIAVRTPNGWAILDETTSQFFGFYKKTFLNQAINTDESKLRAIDTATKNTIPPNAELLVWAKAEWVRQHNIADYSAEIDELTREITAFQSYLDLIAQAGG
jgi:hypothetical protein